MPLVFIHGVNVRKNDIYEKHEIARNFMFRRHLINKLGIDKTQIFSPYWGNLGAIPKWHHASIPTQQGESFGQSDVEASLKYEQYLPLELDDLSNPVLSIARHSFSNAIDALFSLGIETTSDGQTITSLVQIACDANSAIRKPVWLEGVKTDEELIGKLSQTIETQWNQQSERESFGLVSGAWSHLTAGANRLKDFTLRSGSQVFLNSFRLRLQQQVSRFLGDVFVYLKTREQEPPGGPIVHEILADIDRANEHASPTDPLIIIAHSMGGNIVYDILTHYRPDIRCQVLITVGSQVSLFEELKIHKLSNSDLPKDHRVDRINKPENVVHWLNVFDEIDVLGFAAEGVFADVRDYHYSTNKGLLSSHSAYFLSPNFHDRLSARVKELTVA